MYSAPYKTKTTSSAFPVMLHIVARCFSHDNNVEDLFENKNDC